MLSEAQFEAWAHSIGLPQKGIKYLDRVRHSPPARNVKGGKGNTCGRYPSHKMGVTIQFESRTVELAAIYEMEHDPDVLEYWDQPESIKFSYQSKNGRKVGIYHTPDFLVIRRHSVGWEEWKPEQTLLKKEIAEPNRYLRDDESIWRCPPGETVASDNGFYYRVRSSNEINWVYQRNLRLLSGFMSVENLKTH